MSVYDELMIGGGLGSNECTGSCGVIDKMYKEKNVCLQLEMHICDHARTYVTRWSCPSLGHLAAQKTLQQITRIQISVAKNLFKILSSMGVIRF